MPVSRLFVPAIRHTRHADGVHVGIQQEGAAASFKKGETLANYEEIRIRHFERAIDRYIGRSIESGHR